MFFSIIQVPYRFPIVLYNRPLLVPSGFKLFSKTDLYLSPQGSNCSVQKPLPGPLWVSSRLVQKTLTCPLRVLSCLVQQTLTCPVRVSSCLVQQTLTCPVRVSSCLVQQTLTCPLRVSSCLVQQTLTCPLRVSNCSVQQTLTCPLRVSSCSTSRSRSPCPSSICRLKLSSRPWSLLRANSFSSSFPCDSSSFLDNSFFSLSARENCWRNCSAFRIDFKK